MNDTCNAEDCDFPHWMIRLSPGTMTDAEKKIFELSDDIWHKAGMTVTERAFLSAVHVLMAAKLRGLLPVVIMKALDILDDLDDNDVQNGATSAKPEPDKSETSNEPSLPFPTYFKGGNYSA